MKKNDNTQKATSNEIPVKNDTDSYLKMFKKFWNNISYLDFTDFEICQIINNDGYIALVNKIFSQEEQNSLIIDFLYLKLFIIGETLPFGWIREYIVITLLYNLDGKSEFANYEYIATYFETSIEEIQKRENNMLNMFATSKYKFTLPKPSSTVFYHHNPFLSTLYQYESTGLRKLIYLEIVSKYSFVSFSINNFKSWNLEETNLFFRKLNNRINKNVEFAYLPLLTPDELSDARQILNYI